MIKALHLVLVQIPLCASFFLADFNLYSLSVISHNQLIVNLASLSSKYPGLAVSVRKKSYLVWLRTVFLLTL